MPRSHSSSAGCRLSREVSQSKAHCPVIKTLPLILPISQQDSLAHAIWSKALMCLPSRSSEAWPVDIFSRVTHAIDAAVAREVMGNWLLHGSVILCGHCRPPTLAGWAPSNHSQSSLTINFNSVDASTYMPHLRHFLWVHWGRAGKCECWGSRNTLWKYKSRQCWRSVPGCQFPLSNCLSQSTLFRLWRKLPHQQADQAAYRV